MNFCLSLNWQYKAYSTFVSNIYTESNEAFAILLLENNANNKEKMIEKQQKLSRQESNPKYTKDPNLYEKFRGWSREGIRRYNIIKVMMRSRLTTHSK